MTARSTAPASDSPVVSGLRGTFSWTQLLLTSFVGAAVAYCYADVLEVLWLQWTQNEANSHGLLIPFIALYLLWNERHRLSGLTARPVWWVGIPLLSASLAVLLLGRLGGIIGLQEVSVVGTLWALTLLLLGWRALGATWFPAAYLLFMMPIWDFAAESAYYRLQLFAAAGAQTLLSTLGIAVFRDGTVLQLPNTTVEVALACSGVNFLMSVLAIGVVLAYTSTRRHIRRLLIVVTAAVTALVANPLRVALITYTFYSGIASPGGSHAWQGMLVSVAAFAVLFLAARRIAGPELPEAPATPCRLQEQKAPGVKAAFAPVLLVCLALLAAGYARPLRWPTASLDARRLQQLPFQIAGWTANPDERLSFPRFGVMRPDELWREYRHPNGARVRVYIGRFVHDEPFAELRYWSGDFDRVAIYEGAGAFSPVNSAVVRGGGEMEPVLYWYQLNGRRFTSRSIAKLYSAWEAMRGGTGVLAVVVFPGDTRLLPQADGDLARFLSELPNALQTRWPASR